MKIKGKRIWITGASSGIGEALALHCAERGAKLVLSARREHLLNKVKNACPNPEDVIVVPLDLTEFDQLPDIVEKVISEVGKIDCLINNGGVSQRSMIKDTEMSVYKKLIEVNYLGTVALTKAVLPHFEKNKAGHIGVVTSLMGKFGAPVRGGYAGSKHALHGFFDALRAEYAHHNIKVTMICPGYVTTDISKKALTGDGQPQKKMDVETAKGISSASCAKQIIRAIESNKAEVYIGQFETTAVYLKRFFPSLLRKLLVNEYDKWMKKV